jgi:hypothetical protein
VEGEKPSYASFVSLVTAVHNQMALLTIGEIYDMWLAICQRRYAMSAAVRGF